MSIKLMARVWEYEFDHGPQAVLLAMADHANDDGGRCFPSVGLLAWKTGYSERQITRMLKALTDAGALEVVSKSTNRRPTEYRICLHNAQRKTARYESRGDIAMSPQGPSRGDIAMSPQDDSRGDICASRGDICASRGDICASRGDIAMSPEPSLEPSNRTVNSGGAREAKIAPASATATALPPAVEIYRAVTGLTANSYAAKRIADNVTDLGHWRKVLEDWMAASYRAESVDKQIDVYLHGPKVWGDGRRGPRSNRNGFGEMEDKPRTLAQFIPPDNPVVSPMISASQP